MLLNENYRKIKSSRKGKYVGNFILTMSTQNSNNNNLWRSTVYVTLKYLPWITQQPEEIKWF